MIYQADLSQKDVAVSEDRNHCLNIFIYKVVNN